MDVRKKFTLNMTTLVIIVIILSVLVFFSATSSPGSQEPDPEQEPVVFDVETLFEETAQEEQEEETAQETTTLPAETPSTDSPDPQEDEDVLATITFVDNQPPEKQLRQPDAVLTLPAGDTTVSYTVRLHVSWSERLHPNWYPNGAHISPMVAWSHRLKDTLFQTGGIASEGMEIMAESGGTRTLVQEIENITRTGAILSHNTGRVFNAPGEDTIQMTMARNVPYITVVSMIAPSPDWFIAARNVELYKNGRWLERVSVPAPLYDAGTDSGPEFTSANDDTDPKEPISRLRNPPSIPIATFEFIRN